MSILYERDFLGWGSPRCGRRASDYEAASHHFPPNTFLNQKYAVGCVLGEGRFGITYIGLDMRKSHRGNC